MTRLPPRWGVDEYSCDLGLAQVIDEAAAHELYWKLGAIIGQWSREQERLDVSPVAKHSYLRQTISARFLGFSGGSKMAFALTSR
jgi:hypothetical protein